MLEARNLSYARGAIPLISNLSFTLHNGEMFVIRGANGSGKSTLLRIVAGLIRPKPETLYWNGKNLTKQALIDYQQEILYVGHKLALYPDALLNDHMDLWRNVSRETIENAFEVWGLSSFKNKKIAHLSQGQQKRVSLSRCSWLQRRLWILDEPYVGLDGEGRDILSCTISEHLEGGGSVIMATHDGEVGSNDAYKELLL